MVTLYSCNSVSSLALRSRDFLTYTLPFGIDTSISWSATLIKSTLSKLDSQIITMFYALIV
jgi:hypothetical protein